MKPYYVGKTALSACRIVYQNSVLDTKIDSKTGKTVREDIGAFLHDENAAMDFAYQCAQRLQSVLQTSFGFALPLVAENQTEPAEGDLFLGARFGEAAIDGIDRFSYASRLTDDGRYELLGGSFGALWHAVEALELALKADDSQALPTVRGKAPLKVIACLGDSITRGSQSLPDGNGYGTPEGLAASFGGAATSFYFEQFMGYPANLHRALWKDVLVFNYGVGCAAMRNIGGGSFYYQGTAKFKACLARSKEEGLVYDAVFIMLGTNDSGRDGGAATWGEEQKADYYREAKQLLDALLVNSPTANFVLMTLPHRCVCYKSNPNDESIRALQLQTAKQLRADGYRIHCFDMSAYTAAHLGAGHGETKEEELAAHADYYNIRTETGNPDTTHPNHRGYYEISKGVLGMASYLLFDGNAPADLIHLA